MRILSLLFPAVVMLGCLIEGVQAQQSDPFLSGRVREGMSPRQVIEALGTPESQVEMETLRTIRFVYPKRTLNFVDGRLINDAVKQDASQTSPLTTGTTAPKTASQRPPAGSVAAKPAAGPRTIQLESVLSEMMGSKEKPNTQDTSLFPKPGGVDRSMPGAPSIQGGFGGGIGPPSFGSANDLNSGFNTLDQNDEDSAVVDGGSAE